MKLQVFGENVILVLDRLIEEKEIDGPAGTRMKIAVAEVHSERTRIGTVRAKGPDATLYEVGDRVLIAWHTGSHIFRMEQDLFGEKMDEDRFRITTQSEILAKVTEE